MYINSKQHTVKIVLIILLVAGVKGFSQSTATLIPKKGLHITTNGLPWLTGSEINFFTSDKKHHHYFFTWWEQDAQVSKPGQERLFIGSNNTAVNGVYLLEQEGRNIRTYFDCKWNLKEKGMADIVYARIWLPYFSNAVFSSPTQSNIPHLETFNGNRLEVKTDFGTFQFSASAPFRIKTNANLQPSEKDYTRRSQYLTFYEDNIPVTDSPMLSRAFFVEEIQEKNLPSSKARIITVPPSTVEKVGQPQGRQSLLLPLPKSIIFQKGRYILPENQSGPVSPTVSQFRDLLKRQWQLNNKYFPVIQAKENNALPIEGYSIAVKEAGINIQHHSPAGLQHALHTLVQLVENENGQLIIPAVNITDWPSVGWRGIHMFTGPASWALHKRMYDHILLPLKMNKVVLQCEQAQWKSRPELHNAISVPMEDLKKEFDYLRSNHNEPIPLIQSLGHMEWFFKPKENRWMAINPEYPYTLNPNLPQAKDAVKQLWDEAFEWLQPQTMHIGFDEIGMIGFNQPREKEVEYFKTQIDFLHQYSKNKKASLMLWGDMGLGPGEGPDALNGITAKRAATIRSFIPKGALVADWHYINNPDPDIYRTNLQIWKKNGNIPLAAPWLHPNNVRGFVQAAIKEKAGVLQTTWADFESSEKNMLLNMEQFGAYILALDYAWSGRKELPEQLPYDGAEEWITRFYAQPKPVAAGNGFKLNASFQLRDITHHSGAVFADSVVLETGNINASGFLLNATTTNILPEGTAVAKIHFLKGGELVKGKSLYYGVDVRAVSDKRRIYACNGENKKELIDLFEKQIRFDKIVIVNLHPASGLKAEGLTIIE